VSWQAVILALRELSHERLSALCFILAVISVLLPLLVLFGLKFGLVATLAQRLIEDPRSREIIGVGSGRYDMAWFENVEGWGEVGFVMPNTRAISASINMLRNPGNGNRLRGVQMFPSGPGDPLLPPDMKDSLSTLVSGASGNGIILSYLAARRLEAGQGDRLTGYLQRIRGDRRERVKLELTVLAVAPESANPNEVAFVSLPFLEATEDYRDGFSVPDRNWPGENRPTENRIYPRYRLYASSIYTVSALRDRLVGAGLNVRTRAAEIESLQSLDRNLSRIFWMLAGVGTLGFVLSLAANLVSNVDRKRRHLSLIRLVGMPRSALAFFPVSQAAVIAFLGSTLSFAFFLMIASTLNGFFAGSLRPGEAICRLLPAHYAFAFAGTLFTAVAASSLAAVRTARVDPSEGIRDA